MRFFCIASLFCIILASIGCMTKNWSAPLLKDAASGKAALEEGRNFWSGTFGQRAGLDPRAREIEERLGL